MVDTDDNETNDDEMTPEQQWQNDANVAAFCQKVAETAKASHGTAAGAGLHHHFNDDDTTARRYLRARKGDIQGAVDQYLKAEAFFQERQSATILQHCDAREHIYRAICPHLNKGFDREGRPIYMEKTGEIDSSFLLKVTTPYDLVHRHVRQQEIALERMRQSSKRLGGGKLVEDQIIIMDLNGLSMKPNRAAMAVFRACTDIDQAYYPERLHRFYLVNAPVIFRPLWAIIKWWLDPKTKDKFRVLGRNYQEELLQQIAPDQLPVEHGGTAEGLWPEPIPLTEAQEAAAMERVDVARKADKLWEPNPDDAESGIRRWNTDGVPEWAEANPAIVSSSCDP